MILMGILLVKSGVLRAGQSKSLSVVVLYIVMPCVIIHAFQVDYTKEIRNGLLLALLAAVIIHLIMLLVTGPAWEPTGGERIRTVVRYE